MQDVDFPNETAPLASPTKNGRLVFRRFMKMSRYDVESLDEVLRVRKAPSAAERAAQFDEAHAEFRSDAEYLHALLSRESWKVRYFDDCEKLILRLGGLAGVFEASLELLQKVCGDMGLRFSGRFVRMRLDSAMRIERRSRGLSDLPKPSPADSRVSPAELVLSFAHSDAERVRIVYLDAAERIIGMETLATAPTGSARSEAEEVIYRVAKAGAARFVVARNTLTAIAEPTARDDRLTRELAEAARAAGSALSDHLLVSGLDWFSYRQSGRLDSLTRRLAPVRPGPWAKRANTARARRPQSSCGGIAEVGVVSTSSAGSTGA